MSLVNDFKNDCPLSIVDLEKWLKTAFTELDKTKTFTFDGIAIMSIIAKSKNAVINDVCSVTDFNAMFNAVKGGDTVKAVIENTVYIAVASNYNEIESDGYRYVCFDFMGTFKALTGTDTMKVFKIGMELLGNTIRLCDKSIAAITDV